MNDEIRLKIEQPLADVMQCCESFCVFYCCGLDAFDISKESVGSWIDGKERGQVQLACNQVRALIERIQMLNLKNKFVLEDDRLLCIEWTPPEGVAWLIRWETALAQAFNETK